MLDHTSALPLSNLTNAELISYCPRQFNCTNVRVDNLTLNLTSFDIGTTPTYVSVVSSSFSCAGSLLILFAYWLLKDMRTVAQKLITLLAIADLVTATGYLLAGWNFLSHFNEKNHDGCVTFQTVCKIQSFMTTWSTLCSFGWTVALALHFYLILRLGKPEVLAKMLILENILVWILPLAIVVPMLATQRLGYTRYATSNWCYVTDVKYPSSDLQDSAVTIVLMLIAGNLWEMISYVAVIVLYGLIRWQYSVMSKSKGGRDRRSGVERRLLLIPLVFILLRMWGTIQFFFSIATSELNHNGCIPQPVQTIYYILGILQSIGDGGQGWGNAILYVFLSSTIRQELLCAPLVRLIECTGRSLKNIGAKMETVRTWSNSSAVNITRREGPDNETNSLLRRNERVNYSATISVSAAPSMLEQAAPGPCSEESA